MRNIIICCDGTGNEISENISNVLKLYRCLRKTEKTQPRQLVFYDPGVGTLERPDPWHKLKQDFNAILGLATGYGLDDNVLAAYAFLVHNYQAGDQIYLFGFSRGAYTVRVLAGLIHKVGLITPEQVNLAGSGLIAYKQFSSDEAPSCGRRRSRPPMPADAEGPLPQTAFDNAAQFARITSTRWPTIRFVGVWDTVASVIVPRADRFYWPSLEELAFTLRTRACRRSGRRSRSTSAAACSASRSGTTRRPTSTTASTTRMPSRRIFCRCGSPACMPISAAAIRKRKAGFPNIRCSG